MSELKICPFINGKCLIDLCEMYDNNTCAISHFFKVEVEPEEDPEYEAELEKDRQRALKIQAEREKQRAERKSVEKKAEAVIKKYMELTTEQISNSFFEYIRKRDDYSTSNRRFRAMHYESDFWKENGVDITYRDYDFYVKRKEIAKRVDLLLLDDYNHKLQQTYNIRIEKEKNELTNYVDLFSASNPSINKITKQIVDLFLANNNIKLLPETERLFYLTIKDKYKK